jgi:hypothetical protein
MRIASQANASPITALAPQLPKSLTADLAAASTSCCWLDALALALGDLRRLHWAGRSTRRLAAHTGVQTGNEGGDAERGIDYREAFVISYIPGSLKTFFPYGTDTHNLPSGRHRVLP